MFFIGVILVVCLIFIFSPLILIRWISSRRTSQYGNSLLVIAHPDDECLFFSPILLSLSSNIYILCLSNGNNHRSDELRRSCERLRIQGYKIIDDQIHLKDSQTVSWPSDAILGHVKQAIRQWDISTIISFDQYGVSGHRNHISIYYALLNLRQYGRIRFLSLESVPIYRKYLTIVELLMYKSTERNCFILPACDWFLPHRAMFEHRSQLVWFRYLYLCFSRYIWINHFKEIF